MTQRIRYLPTASALALVLIIAACGGRRAPTTAFGVGGDAIHLEVRNNNFQDATIYATREGDRRRLGIVTGRTDRTFDLAWAPGLLLQVSVSFIGGGACETQEFQMEPGQTFTLDLQPDTRTNLDCRPVRGSPGGVRST
jgi:hypothetical protein